MKVTFLNKILFVSLILFTIELKAQTPIAICADQTSFTSMTRGYHFTAPSTFAICGIFVEDSRSTSAQSAEIVRFTAGPPPAYAGSTNSFVSLFYQNNYAPNSMIAVPNVIVNAGDIIGVYGSRATVNSYGLAQCPTTIQGNPVTLFRSGMQFDLATQQMHDIWSEINYYIGRVTISIDCIILPVQLVSFEGECNGSTVELKWSTTSEINNDFFTIEKSLDWKNYNSIGTIQGQGNSSNLTSYSFIDDASQQSYYRLKQTDFDGKSTNYSTIPISCDGEGFFKFYPNPVKDELTVTVTKTGIYSIEIKDYLGRLVLIESISNNNLSHKISLNSLHSKGMYFAFLRNKDGKVIASEKIFKQ